MNSVRDVERLLARVDSGSSVDFALGIIAAAGAGVASRRLISRRVENFSEKFANASDVGVVSKTHRHMIKVENLTKRYAGQTAIDNLNFEVGKGEIMGFLGPNGAGKSTTMRILSSFMPPTSGRASIAGFDIFEKSLQARAHLGYMPENVPLYNDMRVTEYLDYRAALKGVPHRRINERVGRREGALRIERRREKIDRRTFQRLPATRRPGRCARA